MLEARNQPSPRTGGIRDFIMLLLVVGRQLKILQSSDILRTFADGGREQFLLS
jgi:hypothetical protein